MSSYRPEWLAQYASHYHDWKKETKDKQLYFKRRLGIVETSFDIDGTYYEGRADVNSFVSLEIGSHLSEDDVRRRILLAWSNLRIYHLLLMATVVQHEKEKYFLVKCPKSKEEFLQESKETLVFVKDYHEILDPRDFYRHCMNTGRVIRPSRFLSKLFILPSTDHTNGRYKLTMILIAAHQICDGLTIYNWVPHFVDILNKSMETLEKDLDICSSTDSIWSRLPQAQEGLYPPVSGSIARQRWYWAIARILRHVRQPLPKAFPNPLSRPKKLESTVLMPMKYPSLLEYSPDRKPPLSSGTISAFLPPSASTRLQQLSRSINVSVGAGCFALVGLAMMALEESQYPSVPLHQRKPFVASFPLNPRPFFGYMTAADSCMLAFSDGVILPFLPSDLDFEARFRLLARQAHRQLSMYQKRTRGDAETLGAFVPSNPARVIAINYLTTMERVEAKLPPEYQTGYSPQGNYPANFNIKVATCGISSVGDVKKFLSPERYNLDTAGPGGRDFVAILRNIELQVRPRDNEFLVVSLTNYEGTRFDVSFDGSAIDEAQTWKWKQVMETLLEPKE